MKFSKNFTYTREKKNTGDNLPEQEIEELEREPTISADSTTDQSDVSSPPGTVVNTEEEKLQQMSDNLIDSIPEIFYFWVQLCAHFGLI